MLTCPDSGPGWQVLGTLERPEDPQSATEEELGDRFLNVLVTRASLRVDVAARTLQYANSLYLAAQVQSVQWSLDVERYINQVYPLLSEPWQRYYITLLQLPWEIDEEEVMNPLYQGWMILTAGGIDLAVGQLFTSGFRLVQAEQPDTEPPLEEPEPPPP